MNQTVDDWLSALAAHQPTPGGGAAAALLAATAAALIGMVTNYTVGAKWADREAHMKALSDEAAGLRTEALALMDKDAAAFSAVGAAYGLPKATSEQQAARDEAMQKALTLAAEPPAEVSRLALRLVAIADEIAETGNPNVISDVAVAAASARAALEAAIVNIEINERDITDPAAKQHLQQVVAEAAAAIQQADRVTHHVRERLKS